MISLTIAFIVGSVLGIPVFIVIGSILCGP